MFKLIIQNESINRFVEAVIATYYLDLPVENLVTRLDICEEVFVTITADVYAAHNEAKFETSVLDAYHDIVDYIRQEVAYHFKLDGFSANELEFNRFSFIDRQQYVYLELF